MAARRWLGLLNFALLLLAAELRPLGAQTTNQFAGTFDQLFSNGGKVTPIFTRASRPEEFHLRPLTERCGSLSAHTAPTKQPVGMLRDVERLRCRQGLLLLPVGP